MKNKEFTLSSSKGFTLIELLVVIAIIGILSSVVIVSVNTARDKAYDAAVKAALGQLRSVAELIYDDDGAYTNLCDGNGALLTSGSGYDDQISSVETNINVNNGGTNPTCYSDDENYCIQAPLKTIGSAWCFDSGGTGSDTDVFCDDTNFNCEADD